MVESEFGAQVELKVGDPAPDFTLPSHNEGELNLAWYQGRRNVVLAFYPADWTPVCANQIPGYQAVLDKFEQCDAQLLAISVDSIPCHRAWAKSLRSITSIPAPSPMTIPAPGFGIMGPLCLAFIALKKTL